MKDLDTQFLCKDCARYNLCKYYDRRKGDSYICKYFHLAETFGMTNGEVLCMLFPNMHYTLSDKSPRVVTTIGVASSFDVEWWNAPYQKGGEE